MVYWWKGISCCSAFETYRKNQNRIDALEEVTKTEGSHSVVTSQVSELEDLI